MGRMDEPERPEKLGLPVTPFLYHLDQVATMLNLTQDQLIDVYIWFIGRSTGRQNYRKIKAVNIQPEEDGTPEWRVTEGELMRWLKLMGVVIYSRGRAI